MCSVVASAIGPTTITGGGISPGAWPAMRRDPGRGRRRGRRARGHGRDPRRGTIGRRGGGVRGHHVPPGSRRAPSRGDGSRPHGTRPQHRRRRTRRHDRWDGGAASAGPTWTGRWGSGSSGRRCDDRRWGGTLPTVPGCLPAAGSACARDFRGMRGGASRPGQAACCRAAPRPAARSASSGILRRRARPIIVTRHPRSAPRAASDGAHRPHAATSSTRRCPARRMSGLSPA